MIARAIDQLVSAISPQAGLNRQAARLRLTMLATYDAARRDRRSGDERTGAKTADGAIAPDMALINARARAQDRDNPIAKSTVRAYNRNVVGPGITPTPTSPDAAFNRAARRLWRRWACDRLVVDIERKRSMGGLQRLVLAELIRVGQSFIVNVTTGRHPTYPALTLQVLEPEQLDRTLTQAANGNVVRQGIEIDKYGGPVAYYFHPQAPGPGNERIERDPIRVLAHQVAHVADFDRVQQTHGVSWFSPVLRKLNDLQAYDEATVWAARLEACIGLIIKREGMPTVGGLNIPGSGTGEDGDGNRQLGFSPGMIAELAPGEEAEPFIPQRPGGQYAPFTNTQLRHVAAGVGLSYEQLIRDWSKGTYSSLRQSMLEDWKEFDTAESTLVDLWLRPLWQQFITEAATDPDITALHKPADFWERWSEYVSADWHGPDRPWIDPQKEVTAETIALAHGLTTRNRILNRTGDSAVETFDQLEQEHREARDRGLDFPDMNGTAAPPGGSVESDDIDAQDLEPDLAGAPA